MEGARADRRQRRHGRVRRRPAAAGTTRGHRVQPATDTRPLVAIHRRQRPRSRFPLDLGGSRGHRARLRPRPTVPLLRTLPQGSFADGDVLAARRRARRLVGQADRHLRSPGRRERGFRDLDRFGAHGDRRDPWQPSDKPGWVGVTFASIDSSRRGAGRTRAVHARSGRDRRVRRQPVPRRGCASDVVVAIDGRRCARPTVRANLAPRAGCLNDPRRRRPVRPAPRHGGRQAPATLPGS